MRGQAPGILDDMPFKASKTLEGGIVGTVELGRLDGRQCVRKTDTVQAIVGEKAFQETLKKLGLPHITIYESGETQPNQMIMEFIDAPRLSRPNMSAENFAKLGNSIKPMRTSKSRSVVTVDENGALQNVLWSDFIDDISKTAYSSPLVLQNDELRRAVDRAIHVINKNKPEEMVLTHGDAHMANVFITAEGAILFDNYWKHIYAPPEYELTIFVAELFSSYRYGEQVRQGKKDAEFLEALLASADIDLADYPALDAYCLVRSLHRYPNGFVGHQDRIIEILAERML